MTEIMKDFDLSVSGVSRAHIRVLLALMLVLLLSAPFLLAPQPASAQTMATGQSLHLV